MLNSLRLNHQSVELFFVIACCLIDSCCNCCNYCSYCSCYSYCNHSSCSYYNYYSYMKYLHDLDSSYLSKCVVTFSIDCVSSYMNKGRLDCTHHYFVLLLVSWCANAKVAIPAVAIVAVAIFHC